MSALSRFQRLLTRAPIEPGRQAPKLSLTADDGTWVRLADLQGQVNAIFLFFRSLRDDATDAWLKGYQRERGRLEELDAVIFGVTTWRTDRLRELRSELGLEFFLLYDPLGIDSRAFGAASLWRPRNRNAVVLVGKDGTVKLSERGLVPVERLLETVAGLAGTAIPEARATGSEGEFSGVRDPGKAAARVKAVLAREAAALLAQKDPAFVLLDVRTPSEFEADHAEGAVLIPLDELPHRYQELGQTTHILCIGQVGDRSAAAAEFLTSIGCSEVYNVEDGMSAWSAARVTGGRASA